MRSALRFPGNGAAVSPLSVSKAREGDVGTRPSSSPRPRSLAERGHTGRFAVLSSGQWRGVRPATGSMRCVLALSLWVRQSSRLTSAMLFVIVRSRVSALTVEGETGISSLLRIVCDFCRLAISLHLSTIKNLRSATNPRSTQIENLF